MSEKKPKRQRFLTPVGSSLFAHVIEPDAKFNPANPEYSIGLVVSAEDAAGLMQTIEKFVPEAEEAKRVEEEVSRKKGKKVVFEYLPFSETMVDPDTGDDLDTVKFKFKAHSLYTDRKTQQTKELRPPAIHGANGAQLSGEDVPKFIGNGSRVRVLFEVIPWASGGLKKYGLSLRLIAVKIIELRRGGGISSSEMGGDESEPDTGADYGAPDNEDDGNGDF